MNKSINLNMYSTTAQVLSKSDPDEVSKETNIYSIYFIIIGIITGLSSFIQVCISYLMNIVVKLPRLFHLDNNITDDY